MNQTVVKLLCSDILHKISFQLFAMVYSIYIFVYLDTFCFDETTYVVSESAGLVQLTLGLSRPLQDDIFIRFRYFDLTAIGKLRNFN